MSKIFFDLTRQTKCTSLYFIVILQVQVGTRLLHLLCTLQFRKSSLWQRLWPITESQWVHKESTIFWHSSLSKRLSPGWPLPGRVGFEFRLTFSKHEACSCSWWCGERGSEHRGESCRRRAVYFQIRPSFYPDCSFKFKFKLLLNSDPKKYVNRPSFHLCCWVLLKISEDTNS